MDPMGYINITRITRTMRYKPINKMKQFLVGGWFPNPSGKNMRKSNWKSSLNFGVKIRNP